MPKKKKSFHYEKLLKKWILKHKKLQKEIFETHQDVFDWFENNSKQLAVGSLAGVFMLTNPIVPKIPTAFSSNSAVLNQSIDKKVFLSYRSQECFTTASAAFDCARGKKRKRYLNKEHTESR